MKIAFKGILRRTFLNFLLVALLPLLLLSAVVYKIFVEVSIKETRSTLNNISRYAANEIENSLDGHLVSIKTWASVSIPKVALTFNRPEGATKFVDDLALLTKEYDLVYITDRDGKVFALNSRDAGGKRLRVPGVQGRSPGRSSCPRLREGEAGICVGRLPGVLAELLGSREAIQLSAPLRDDGGADIGGIHAVVAPSRLDAVLEEINGAYLAPAFPGSGIKLSGRNGGNVIASSSGLFNSDITACHPVSAKGGAGLVSLELCCSLDKRGILKSLNSFKKYFFIILFFTVVITALAAFYFSRIIAVPVLKLEHKTKNLVLTDFVPSNDINTGDELEDLNNAFNAMMVQIRDYQFKLVESTRNKVMTQVAAQVAHDIRSPLAALDSLAKDLALLPEEKRVIVRSSLGRIRDIANDLIKKNRQLSAPQAGPSAAGAEGEPRSAHLLSCLIEGVVTEKRLQFRSKIGLDIDAGLDKGSYGLFAKVQPAEFQRVLSNIMNNAVEALDKSGFVLITMGAAGAEIVITVKDNGKGIPPGVMPGLFKRGETHGKEGGTGLGLYHAREALSGWGGRIDLKSKPGKGTEVRIRLPRAETPAWFLPGLAAKPGSAVVVLDDDNSIHQVWQGRFESLKAGEQKVKLIHFSTPSEFRAWVKADPGAAMEALYLLDYELLGYGETGLSLAEELGLGRRAVLVTSRYEESHVLEHCLRLKVRLMPKGLAGLVPISISDPAAPGEAEPPQSASPAVLIDDDALVRLNWRSAAHGKGVELKTFSSPEEFYADGYIAKDAAIYIDSELGGGVKGEEIAQTLKDKGYANIRLETGHPPEKFCGMPWMEVVGKEPPWA